MSAKMTPLQLATWQDLHRATEMLQREVGRSLRDSSGLSDTEFSVLARLVDHGGPLRSAECARALGWDSSRLSHQLGRLEKRGLIERSQSGSSDKRASVIAVTADGRAAHRAAVGPHLRAATRWFADALDDEQLQGLADALSALLAHGHRMDEADASQEEGS